MVYRQTERSEKVREASRSKILTAARRLFRVKGYERTTIQQIVKEAASSVGNLYFYFRNKEVLLLAVVTEAFDLIWSVGEEAMSTVPRGPKRLVVLQHVNVIAAYQHPDLAQLVLSDQYPSVVDFIETEQQRRFSAVLAENSEPLTQENLELAVAAWAGAARNALLTKLKKNLDIDLRKMSLFVSRWNLRALGLQEEEIDAALEVIDQLDTESLAAQVAQISSSTRGGKKKSRKASSGRA